MRTLIVYHSEHHGNTEKIARAIAPILDAELLKSAQTQIDTVEEYDLVGFGSGIYYSKFHANLYKFIERLPRQDGKRSFIFSTTGSKTYSARGHEQFGAVLKEKGFIILGEYSCLGFDTALSTEGINRGRPDDQDLREAEEFARGLKELIDQQSQ